MTSSPPLNNIFQKTEISAIQKTLMKKMTEDDIKGFQEIWGNAQKSPEDLESVNETRLIRKACESSNIDMFQALINLGFHKKDLTGAQDLLRTACWSNCPEKIKALVDIGYEAEYINTGYITACRVGAMKTIEYIEQNKWDEPFKESVYYYAIEGAIESNQLDMLKHLLSKNQHKNFAPQDNNKLLYTAVETIEYYDSDTQREEMKKGLEILEIIYNLATTDKEEMLERLFVRHMAFYSGDKTLLNYLLSKDNSLIQKLASGHLGDMDLHEEIKEMVQIQKDKKILEKNISVSLPAQKPIIAKI